MGRIIESVIQNSINRKRAIGKNTLCSGLPGLPERNGRLFHLPTEPVVLYTSGMSHIKNQHVTFIGRLGRGWATDPLITAIHKGIRVRGSHNLPKGVLGVLSRYSSHAPDVAIVDTNLPEYTQRLVISHILDKYEELSSENNSSEEFNVTIEESDLRQHQTRYC